MTHEVEKDTFINADEKTTKALTYDMLNGLHEKLDAQLLVCNNRFKSLEDKKKRDSVTSAAFGFGGGFMAVVAKWVKDLF